MLNIKNMITGEINRLSAVIRFNNAYRIRDESVAEHVGFVSIYATMLGHWYEDEVGALVPLDIPLDWRELMTRVTLHDAEEGLSGDFPRPFKYSSPAISKALNIAAHDAAITVFADMLDDDESVVKYFHDTWKHAKDKTIEGAILSICDFLSTLSYVHRETSMGNKMILECCGDFHKTWHNILMIKLVEPFHPILIPTVHHIIKELVYNGK